MSTTLLVTICEFRLDVEFPLWCVVHFGTANMIKGVQNSAKSTCFISFSHDLPCHLLSLTAWLPSCQQVHKQNILLVWYAIIARAILAKYGTDNDNDKWHILPAFDDLVRCERGWATALIRRVENGAIDECTFVMALTWIVDPRLCGTFRFTLQNSAHEPRW